MELRTELLQKQIQKLLLLPQMQQAMKILQLPIMELRGLLEKEIQENPFLEKVEESSDKEENSEDPFLKEVLALDDNWKDYFKAVQNTKEKHEEYRPQVSSPSPSLQESLLRQLNFCNISKTKKEIGEILIANIDENGYLKVSLEDVRGLLHVSEEEIKEVLKIIQSFDPPGVGARNLEECLLLQLKRKKKLEPLIEVVIKNYLGDIGGKNFSTLAKKLGVNEKTIRKIAEEISTLEPKPGREYFSQSPMYIIPDVSVKKTQKGYLITVNQEGIPPLRINSLYRKILEEGKNRKKEYEFLREKLKDAVWFLRNLNGRGELVRKVSEFIVDKQKEFFEKGPEHLKPLILKEVADALGVHISTISRITSRKYIETPRGVFPMKYFFSGQAPGREEISSTSLKEEIKKIIEKESSKKPLSDEKISQILRSKGFPIARRTVNKYREELGILPARMRRK